MGKQNQAHRIVPNMSLNRLNIKIVGKLSKQDLRGIYTDVRFAIADLSPGFDVITDLRECTLGLLDGIESMNKITNYLIGNKVKCIVRIVNDRHIVSRQVMNLEARKHGYKVIYVNSHEKAEMELEKASQREGLRVSLLHHSLEYTTEAQTGTATLLDISTSGCAVTSATIMVEVDTNISIQIIFKSHLDLLEIFKCTGQVVWADEIDFAIKFNTLDNTLMEALWTRLVFECE